MKKYIIIALLCLSMGVFAQTGNEFVYQIDEIAIQEAMPNGNFKEEQRLNILNNEIQYHIVRNDDYILVLSGFEQPLMMVITSEYQKAVGIAQYRGVDIDGGSISCIINENSSNIFFVISPTQRMRFHVYKHFNIDTRSFPIEGRHNRIKRL